MMKKGKFIVNLLCSVVTDHRCDYESGTFSKSDNNVFVDVTAGTMAIGSRTMKIKWNNTYIFFKLHDLTYKTNISNLY